MSPLVVRLLVGLALLLAAFGGGWHARGVVEDVEDAKQAEAMQRAVDAFHAHEKKIATTLDEKLRSLKANERVIEREVPKIIDRPVYRNVCVDDDGMRLLEEARTGKAGAGKPANKVSAEPK